jgi:hypothetical protein
VQRRIGARRTKDACTGSRSYMNPFHPARRAVPDSGFRGLNISGG